MAAISISRSKPLLFSKAAPQLYSQGWEGPDNIKTYLKVGYVCVCVCQIDSSGLEDGPVANIYEQR
jgi:hypothetical protein